VARSGHAAGGRPAIACCIDRARRADRLDRDGTDREEGGQNQDMERAHERA
jgi:hypothetical protein